MLTSSEDIGYVHVEYSEPIGCRMLRRTLMKDGTTGQSCRSMSKAFSREKTSNGIPADRLQDLCSRKFGSSFLETEICRWAVLVFS